MFRWGFLVAAAGLGFLSATALAESGNLVSPLLPPYKTVPGPDKTRLTFYRAQGELAQIYSIGMHDFCALAGMAQSNTGAPCACNVDFHKDDGWELVLMTQSSLGYNTNVSKRQHCECRAVCWNRPKPAK